MQGLEQELTELYARGEISLRHMAEILSLSVRGCLDLLWRQGVPGNVTMAQALDSLEVAETLGS